MILAFVFVLLAAPQSEEELARWVRQLGDDSIEARDDASQALVRAGRAAEKALAEAAQSENDEVRSRAQDILVEIDRRERVRAFEAGPSRITLTMEKASTRRVLEEIQRQTRTALDVSQVGESREISVAFSGVPLLEAIESVCKAHGALSYECEGARRDEAQMTLAESAGPKRPRAVAEQYLIQLDSLLLETRHDLQGGKKEKTRLEWRWFWEKGTRPSRAELILDELQDDLGNSYRGDVRDPIAVVWGDGAQANTRQTMILDRVPPVTATRFALIRGSLELHFPENVEVFRIAGAAPELEKWEERGGIRACLREFDRRKARLRIRLDLSPPEAIQGRLEIVAVDTEGQEHRGRWKLEETSNEAMSLQADVRLPAEAEVREVRVVAPLGVRTKKVPFEFRDVRFR